MMTDFDVVVADALRNDETVVELLGDREFGIFNTHCDFKGRFPLIIFRKRGRSPVLHYDNRMHGYSCLYNVIVCSKETEAVELADEVYRAMTDAGFMWTGTDTEYNSEYHEYYTILGFSIGEEL